MKYTTAVYKEVASNEVEKTVKDYFDIDDYSVVAAEECSNDTSISVNVTGEVDDYDLEQMDKYLSGDSNVNIHDFSVNGLMDYLASKGVIETGNYLIDASW